MTKRFSRKDYQTVSRSRSQQANGSLSKANAVSDLQNNSISALPKEDSDIVSFSPGFTSLKRGHAISFAALFLFTIVLYARPAEFYPSVWTNSLALMIGVVTLACFAVTQIALEGNLTSRPPEVNLVLLFILTGLLSIPLAISPSIAWATFSGTFIRGVLIFIVIINVVRTEARLKFLVALSIATAILLSAGAINDYRLGLATIEGYRAAGRGTGIFGNTNDMALHLVTMAPISIALFFSARGPLRKAFHATCASIMISGILLSYSRGAFLGLLVVVAFFSVKLARSSRLSVAIGIMVAVAAILVLAPSGYGNRLLSMFVPGLDPGGTADARRGELIRSAYYALRHPLLGVGMGNYQPLVSFRGLVSHNSYTQVASEMGLMALALYVMFIVSPLRKLSVVARETFATRKNSSFFYLALGLQASLLAYMVSSFFLSVAYSWNVYYLVGYAVCFRRLYESNTGKLVTIKKRTPQNKNDSSASLINADTTAATA